MESVADKISNLNSELLKLSEKSPYKESLRGLYSLVLAREVLDKSPGVIGDFRSFSGYDINLLSASKTLGYYLSDVNNFKAVIDEYNPDLLTVLDDYSAGKVPGEVMVVASIFDYLSNKPDYVSDSRLSFLADYAVNLACYVNDNPISSLISQKKKERLELVSNLIAANGYALESVKRDGFYVDVKSLFDDKPLPPHSHKISLGEKVVYLDLEAFDSQVFIDRGSDFLMYPLDELISHLNYNSLDEFVDNP